LEISKKVLYQKILKKSFLNGSLATQENRKTYKSNVQGDERNKVFSLGKPNSP
jgi:hypothetical protein